MHPNEAADFVVLGLIIAAYFVPTVVAKYRDKKNTEAIFLVNLIFGWSMLGWIAALTWALYAEKQMVNESPTADAPNAVRSSEPALNVVEWK